MLTRILIVDDSELVRQGLRTVLRANPGWEICDEASDGLTAVEKFRDLHPHVVILDFQMPGLNGLEIARRMLKSRRFRHGHRVSVGIAQNQTSLHPPRFDVVKYRRLEKGEAKGVGCSQNEFGLHRSEDA